MVQILGFSGNSTDRPLCLSQELLPSVLERPMNRFKPMRAQGDPGQKLGHHESVQQTSLGVGWPGHTEDVMAKPFHQQGDDVVQRDRRVKRGTGAAEPLG